MDGRTLDTATLEHPLFLNNTPLGKVGAGISGHSLQRVFSILRYLDFCSSYISDTCINQLLQDSTTYDTGFKSSVLSFGERQREKLVLGE